MNKKRRGYILIEMLMAVTFFALAGTSVALGVVQAAHAQKTLHEEHRNYFYQTTLSVRLDQDLHNIAVIEESIFTGKEKEMRFPVTVWWEEHAPALVEVNYYFDSGALWREEKVLSADFRKPPSKKIRVLNDVRKLQFFYPYLDEKQQLALLPFWIDKPYTGPPRSVLIKAEIHDGLTFEKTLDVPLGHYGKIPDET